MIVYILKSESRNKYYVGVTSDLKERLKRHNQGRNKSTRSFRPWSAIYVEEYSSKSEALRRESEIKSYKGGNSFKKLLNNAGIV